MRPGTARAAGPGHADLSEQVSNGKRTYRTKRARPPQRLAPTPIRRVVPRMTASRTINPALRHLNHRHKRWAGAHQGHGLRRGRCEHLERMMKPGQNTQFPAETWAAWRHGWKQRGGAGRNSLWSSRSDGLASEHPWYVPRKGRGCMGISRRHPPVRGRHRRGKSPPNVRSLQGVAGTMLSARRGAPSPTWAFEVRGPEVYFPVEKRFADLIWLRWWRRVKAAGSPNPAQFDAGPGFTAGRKTPRVPTAVTCPLRLVAGTASRNPRGRSAARQSEIYGVWLGLGVLGPPPRSTVKGRQGFCGSSGT